MKSKIIGISVLLFVIILGGGYYFFRQSTATTTLNGYLGGEKIGLFEDEEVQEIFQKKYHLRFEYSRAGSLDMVTADQSGRNYLFPSSQTALQYFQETNGKPAGNEIIFNTPVVLYSHKMVAEALEKKGIVSKREGVYYADMAQFAGLIRENVKWSDLGLAQLYGSVTVDTTDPTRSNSGNMFAALLANVLNDGKTTDSTTVNEILPQLKEIFSRLGYMETSSSDLFNQFIRMGVGAKPVIAGYENQLLEYAAEKPDEYKRMKDDIVIIYPTPTLWSTHIYIALDEIGKAGVEALSDVEIQKLAWEKHGFRTNSYQIAKSDANGGQGGVAGIPEELTSVMNMPDYATMKCIIEYLK